MQYHALNKNVPPDSSPDNDLRFVPGQARQFCLCRITPADLPSKLRSLSPPPTRHGRHDGRRASRKESRRTQRYPNADRQLDLSIAPETCSRPCPSPRQDPYRRDAWEYLFGLRHHRPESTSPNQSPESLVVRR